MYLFYIDFTQLLSTFSNYITRIVRNKILILDC